MRIALNGHTTAQALQPVQPATSCKCARLRQPSACSHSTCGPQAATQRPQPVQRLPTSGRRGADEAAVG